MQRTLRIWICWILPGCRRLLLICRILESNPVRKTSRAQNPVQLLASALLKSSLVVCTLRTWPSSTPGRPHHLRRRERRRLRPRDHGQRWPLPTLPRRPLSRPAQRPAAGPRRAAPHTKRLRSPNWPMRNPVNQLSWLKRKHGSTLLMEIRRKLLPCSDRLRIIRTKSAREKWNCPRGRCLLASSAYRANPRPH